MEKMQALVINTQRAGFGRDRQNQTADFLIFIEVLS